MSDVEEIWFDPGHEDPASAAADLSKALDMRLEHVGDQWYVSTEHLSDSEPVRVWGRVEANIDSRFPAEKWPDDYSVFHRLPLVWTLESVRTGGSTLIERSRVLFDRLVARLPWRFVLTHGIDVLVATYDPIHGLREFPPGTPADGTGRHLWG